MFLQRALGAAVATAALFASSAAAQFTAPVTGEVANKRGEVVGTFTGEFTLEEFRVVNDQLMAVGKLSGTIEREGKKDLNVKNRRVALPVDLEASGVTESDMAAADGDVEALLQECDVLHLELGPLDLNLLGLEVSLNRVILDIDADPTGGLLGQLLSILCGLNLGGILDLLGDIALLADLLNLILDLIGG